MNKENIQIAIDCMQRVVDEDRKFDMCNWQVRDFRIDRKKTEKELHQCGMPACFGGWLAVDPRFIEKGGQINSDGSPGFGDEEGPYAISKFLEISYDLADALVETCRSELSIYNHDERKDITAKQVRDALIEVRDSGKISILREIKA